ncbi:MAG: hypothetical protein ACI905_002485 [Roseivirga sp.]|jgi:hypothetical protein
MRSSKKSWSSASQSPSARQITDTGLSGLGSNVVLYPAGNEVEIKSPIKTIN